MTRPQRRWLLVVITALLFVPGLAQAQALAKQESSGSAELATDPWGNPLRTPEAPSGETIASAMQAARQHTSDALSVGWAHCQAGWPPRPSNVSDYLALRTAMAVADRALDRAQALERPWHETDEATDRLIARVDALIAYLNTWLNSGEIPRQVEAEALAQRYVLFENLVSLHASVGRCAASHTAMETLHALDASRLGPEYEALRSSASAVSAACEPRHALRANDPALRASPPRRASRALWAIGGGGLASGIALALAEPGPQGERRARAAVGLASSSAAVLITNAVFTILRPRENQRRPRPRVSPNHGELHIGF